MIGPVSGTGRTMMASLQQAIQKGMPPDQAIQYVKSMATQGVAPLTDLYAMMNQFQRLKQQPVQAPQTPPTIRDQLNMAEQQQAQQQMAMQQGLGGMPAPAMEQAQFAGGGIVAFVNGGGANSQSSDSIEDMLIRRYVPEYDSLPPEQQDFIKQRLAPQIEAAKSATDRGPVSATSKVPTLAEQRALAAQRANRPLMGYEAEIAARAAATGEGKTAELMREKLQKRMEGLDESGKKSRGMALTQLGAQIMQAASQPGATAFGSIGAGLAKGLPMFEELQQRQQALKERYEDRVLELQQADELRKSGYYKEATVLEREAKADLKALDRASAENELAMERIRYQEGAATGRAKIQADAEAERTDTRTKNAAARAAERSKRLRTAVIGKTKQRLAVFSVNDPGASEYQKAQKAVGNARKTGDKTAIEAAEAEVKRIFDREVANDMRDYEIQSGGSGINPEDDPLDLNN